MNLGHNWRRHSSKSFFHCKKSTKIDFQLKKLLNLRSQLINSLHVSPNSLFIGMFSVRFDSLTFALIIIDSFTLAHLSNFINVWLINELWRQWSNEQQRLLCNIDPAEHEIAFKLNKNGQKLTFLNDWFDIFVLPQTSISFLQLVQLSLQIFVFDLWLSARTFCDCNFSSEQVARNFVINFRKRKNIVTFLKLIAK